MSNEEIKTKIVTLLLEEELLINNMSIQDDEPLEVYGMNSYAFIRMIVRIEEVFCIEVPNEFLVFNKWSTIRQICECLTEIINEIH